MTGYQRFQKRTFDVVVSFFGLLFLWWLIVVAALLAYIDTGLSGFFKQERVGKDGQLFKVIKIRSMRPVTGVNTSVTTDKDPRISKTGRFWRKTKIDELPQLWNVLVGNMSFVGPRPDVPGYADKLEGKDRLLLSIRPGITGPASIKFKNEEEILAAQKNPEKYNREVIWPEKVRINLEYIENYSLLKDIGYILKTVF
ncbi:sugar transferase [Sinomicrobium kalidii]|uniref:sugar transferase n=1 Tax=Sinomicrobium kalidii TaxID=2900738 RepID=UPI001E43DC54|nr:sugar transferase [Sinomicrobium kalidii]UGU14387.1 sugar transferase [Sinomicrobium kalidii]